jgi:2'-5' RNA ligase
MIEKRRVFFGFEARAPWPETKYPPGRLLSEHDRHMTVAFLGSILFNPLESFLTALPKPQFEVGFSGVFDKILFLPPSHSNVVSLHVNIPSKELNSLKQFHVNFVSSLIDNQLLTERERDRFLPHVTLCRTPFDQEQWDRWFTPLPVVFQNFNLYESIGNLRYPIIWKYELKAPFIEIEHTADIAYHVFGKDLNQIYNNALTALSFRMPVLCQHLHDNVNPHNLDDVIILLNDIIGRADAEHGCPFKAISFHGDLIQESSNCYKWEMIVDV